MEYVFSHCISGSILLLESYEYLFFAVFPYDFVVWRFVVCEWTTEVSELLSLKPEIIIWLVPCRKIFLK